MNLDDLSEYKEAYIYAADKHMLQKRKFSNNPYMVHPEFVACMLVRYTTDSSMIKAALLHDIVEDTSATHEDIEELFGSRVANLVFELTSDPIMQKELGKKNYLTIKLNNMSEDALLIKLLDRLHNVMDCLPHEVTFKFREWYWKETHYIIANLDRDLTVDHANVITSIEFILSYLELMYLTKNAKIIN